MVRRIGDGGDVATAVGERRHLAVPIGDGGQLVGAVAAVARRVAVAVRHRRLVAAAVEGDGRAVGHGPGVDKGRSVLGERGEVAGRGDERATRLAVGEPQALAVAQVKDDAPRNREDALDAR